jgi:acetyl-CoA carboxylase biotin carboxylase subunit
MPRTPPTTFCHRRVASTRWGFRVVPGVRFDSMLYPSCTVPPFYDSLLGKLIVWDEDRERALARLRRALGELEVAGVVTTKPLHQALAHDSDVIAGRFDTGFLERWLEINGRRLATVQDLQASAAVRSN